MLSGRKAGNRWPEGGSPAREDSPNARAILDAASCENEGF